MARLCRHLYYPRVQVFRMRVFPEKWCAIGCGLLLAWLFLSGCNRPTPSTTALKAVAIPELLPLADRLATAYSRLPGRPVLSAVVVPPDRLVEALSDGNASLAFSYGLSATKQLSSTVIAWEALAVAVPVTNPVKSLTLSQVRQIFGGQITNWAEAGGYSQPIVPISREEGAPSRLLFEQVVMGQGVRVTRNALVLADDEGLVATLASLPGAIGYVSLRALAPGVMPLSLDGVSPGVVAVKKGLYPLIMPVVVLTVGPPEEAVGPFWRFLRGKEGRAILQSLGYVPAD